MRIFITLLLGLFTSHLLQAQLQPVDDKSQVKFTIKNFGINTGGSFKGLEGTIVFDASNPGAGAFDISIDANTVNTDNGARDNHLRKEEYFDVTTYPRITFKSEKITGKSGSYNVSGKLTIKGISKDVSFPFKASTKDDGYLFEGSFQLNRRDFKVGGNSMVLSDNVIVTLVVETKKK